MGLCLAAASPTGMSTHSAAAYVTASLAPDFFFLPLAFVLGRENKRRFWIPRNADWEGARARHPRATALSWDAPYSLLGAALVIGLLAKWAGVGLAIAYGLHIAVDYPTHSGEWSVRPWYPFSKRPLQGVSSAWEWPMAAMARAWGVWALVLVTVIVVRSR